MVPEYEHITRKIVNMKKRICIMFVFIGIVGLCSAQEKAWDGTVRFNPADIFINVHNAIPGIYITWTPYILPNLGIPAEIDVNVGWGILPGAEISLLTGVEYIPIGPAGKDKNGLFLDVKSGLSLFFHEGIKPFFIAKANVGYQLLFKKGFVFTPAVGAVYNGRSGFGLNLMLDIGFAYRRRQTK
jgi:hypothetical protein